jgi:hypothetical protein
MRGGSNINHSQRNVSDRSTQTGQGSGQPEAQICVYFLTIAETKSIAADHLTLDPVLATPPQTPHLNKDLKNHPKNHA